MDWFLYDNGLRHERVKFEFFPLKFTKIFEQFFPGTHRTCFLPLF